jgi:hypothetical protein
MQQWRAAVLTSALLALTPTPSLAAPVLSWLAFGVDVTADAGELLEILFGYDVSHPAIAGASLAMSGASATGDATLTAGKTSAKAGPSIPAASTGARRRG